MKLMTTLAALAATTMMVGSLAMADDKAASKETEKTTHNPMTGTDTTTKEMTDTAKGADGQKHDVKVKEKVKKHKDGKMDKEVKVKAEETTKP